MKRTMRKWRTIILLFLPAAIVVAQQHGTRVDLSKQSNVDFSRAATTKPAQTGSTPPAGACSPGEVYFSLASSVTPGQNLYLCTATNTWTQLTGTGSGGGGGGTPVTSTSTLTDLSVTLNASTPNQLTIGSGCAVSAPCNVRFGGSTTPISTSTTLTLSSGANVGGMARIFVSSLGTITVLSSLTGGGVITCNGCTVFTTSQTPQFPSDCIPLATWTAFAGVWDPTGGTDVRAFLSNRSSVTPGSGITIADAPGNIVVSVDSTQIGLRVAPPATAAAACVEGVYATDSAFFYQCVATNTWLRVALATW